MIIIQGRVSSLWAWKLLTEVERLKEFEIYWTLNLQVKEADFCLQKQQKIKKYFQDIL